LTSDVSEPSDLGKNALRLKELERLIVKAVVEWDTDILGRSIAEFNELKTQTRLALMRNPITALSAVADEHTRALLQKISSGEPLPVEGALAGTRIGTLLGIGLSNQELEELGSEFLYSWTSHYEFVEALYEIGSLILATGQVPQALEQLVDEARHCYAFQQYNAVSSLARTMLEVAMRDLLLRWKVLPSDFNNVQHLQTRAPAIYDLIEKFCGTCAAAASLRERLHAIRKEGNAVVHGRRAPDRDAARALLRDTLLVLHQAYETLSEVSRSSRGSGA
jgi:hypothetical protein